MSPPSGSDDARSCTAARSRIPRRAGRLPVAAPLVLALVLAVGANRASAESAPADGPVFLRTASVLALGGNLIANPGAEDGAFAAADSDLVAAIPGWTRAGDVTVADYATKPGRWPTVDDPGPVERGSAFFTGGPQVPVDSLWQAVDLSALAALTDAGAVDFDAAAYLGGISSSEDNVALRLRFLDAGGAPLGAAVLGPVTAGERGGRTGLLPRAVTGTLPAGARAAVVTMVFTGTSGQNCWALADSIGLSLTWRSAADVPPPPVPSGLRLDVVPDPVVAEASIALTLPAAGPARVEVLDVTGRRVALLADGQRAAGRHELRWSPRGSGAGAGVYFVRLAGSSGTLVRKLVTLAR